MKLDQDYLWTGWMKRECWPDGKYITVVEPHVMMTAPSSFPTKWDDPDNEIEQDDWLYCWTVNNIWQSSKRPPRSPIHLGELPIDPMIKTSANTNYYIEYQPLGLI